MLNTFDRYLLKRFVHAFAALFISAVGLFTVVDGFMNLDGFQHSAKKASAADVQNAAGTSPAAADRPVDSETLALLIRMGRHYVLQTSMLLDLLGPTAAVLAVLVTMALIMKQGELHPILAAGVSTYRLATPFIIGVLGVNALMTFNQEMIIPRIASELQADLGEDASTSQQVEAQYDLQSWIFLTAESVRLSDRTLVRPDFQLPCPDLCDDIQKISAESAKFYPARGRQPAGWLLKSPQPSFDSLRLTDQGRRMVRPQSRTGDLFIVSSLSADQLYNRGGSFRYLTTPELLRRIQAPAGSHSSARASVMHLHSRLTRPIITLIGVFLVLPLIARRERMSLVQNVAICMATLGFVYGLSLAGSMLGQSAVMKPELAIWGPLVFGGGLSAWLTGCIRT